MREGHFYKVDRSLRYLSPVLPPFTHAASGTPASVARENEPEQPTSLRDAANKFAQPNALPRLTTKTMT